MNVVDSSGWLAYFGGSGNADFFAAPIQNIEHLLVPTVCLYEVSRRLLALRGEEAALKAAALMGLGRTVDMDSEIALRAAQIAAETGLTMADSMVLAAARANDAVLWTQVGDFESFENVKYVAR